MSVIVDYHMHTPLCRHAEGTPDEYAQSSLRRGLKEIGFSDHAPLVAYDVPDVCMTSSELPLYHDMIRAVQKKYSGKLLIKIGLEADYISGYENETRKILAAFPYDYVIGSVHFINGWCFDNPEDLERWNDADVNAVYHDYYALLRKAAQSGLFNIMGHVDLVKKFGHRPQVDLTDEIIQTARVFHDCGAVVEINTAGLRKPVAEIYPSLDALKIYRREHVAITFGSDAHKPAEVGMDFDRARDLALAAGYLEYVLFDQRKVAAKVNL